jgi:hypothetical protein
LVKTNQNNHATQASKQSKYHCLLGLKAALELLGDLLCGAILSVYVAIDNMIDRGRGAGTERNTQITKQQYLHWYALLSGQ